MPDETPRCEHCDKPATHIQFVREQTFQARMDPDEEIGFILEDTERAISDAHSTDDGECYVCADHAEEEL